MILALGRYGLFAITFSRFLKYRYVDVASFAAIPCVLVVRRRREALLAAAATVLVGQPAVFVLPALRGLNGP
jgi:hypothetical protein